jgi:ribosomal-protein-alanine N-acetyltransferase
MPEAPSIPSIYPASIVGERVRLREVDEDDFEATWTRWGSRTEFFRFLPIEQPTTLDEEHAWLASVINEARAVPRRQYQLGIDAAGGLVGMVRLGIDSERHRSADLGYGVGPDEWGQGYATEAARLIVRFGFETLGLHRIWATHHPENLASRRVLDKLGFVEEGRRRDDRFVDGAWYDSVVCSMLESDASPDRALTT